MPPATEKIASAFLATVGVVALAVTAKMTSSFWRTDHECTKQRQNDDDQHCLQQSNADRQSLQSQLSAAAGLIIEDLRAVQRLIKAGAHVNNTDADKRAPLHTAAERGHHQVVQCLIDANAHVDQPSADGSTPLFVAAAHWDSKTVQVLIEAGADLDKPDRWGTTPLHVAATLGRQQSLQLLIEAGAQINKPNRSGMTPLQLAGECEQLLAVQLLTESGALFDPIRT